MKNDNMTKTAARIAARANVNTEAVLRAYRKAARGAAVNAEMLFITERKTQK